MFKSIAQKILGSYNDRRIKKILPVVDQINSLESKYQAMNDEELKNTTVVLRAELANGKTLDDILPDAFAAVRETSFRQLGMRHFDVQLIGGYVLHSGKISEMKTGEGKTLVATLALYLNALSGKGAHLVTVNDYLARRDAMWMAPVYLGLGLSVGVIQPEVSYIIDWDESSQFKTKLVKSDKVKAYASDITYGTNNEFGFDYLRDNMKYEFDEMAQKNLNFAIVDEVDSILVDEARTPLIISGPTDEKTDKYYMIDQVVRKMVKDTHFTIDEKSRNIQLTDEGINFAEKSLNLNNLYDAGNVDILHHLNNSIKAWSLFHKDVDYVVNDGQVVIVDEFTGRLMSGRRYSDGLHQALEAKEGVKIESENQTYAAITFQNFFRMYDKLSGMTGTASTEAEEFKFIYGLDVVSIPTHRNMIRKDQPDVIYQTVKEKYNAIIEEIEEMNKQGRPVLVGTSSIEKSEIVSELLKRTKIKFETLNAKNHEKEASIIADAGQKGAVTIATNMAGRGTDIKLGEGVKELGGLHIIGTERHESRRIDNQLRGRAGRQGDPGSSKFFMSLEDDLLRIFGSEKIQFIMSKLGLKEGEAIEHSIISKAIENAQKKVESMHFEIRKHLLDYDNVLNQQRHIIYDMRRSFLNVEEADALMEEVLDNVINIMLDNHVRSGVEADYDAFNRGLEIIFDLEYNLDREKTLNMDATIDEIKKLVSQKYQERKEQFGDLFIVMMKLILIHILDNKWREQLMHMDYLRDSVGLRGYGQKDPLNEYKKEAYELFVDMMNRIYLDVVEFIFHAEPVIEKNTIEEDTRAPKVIEERRDVFAEEEPQEEKKAPVKRNRPKTGRNDDCYCGSGQKYKNCCEKKDKETGLA